MQLGSEESDRHLCPLQLVLQGHPGIRVCALPTAACLCLSHGASACPIALISFILFFPLREEECSPVHEKTLPHTPYVVQSCEIPVSNSSSQSQYHVSVRAKTEEKLIEAYKNSEFLCCFLLLRVSWRDACLSKWD